jgi:hypothetical protein
MNVRVRIKSVKDHATYAAVARHLRQAGFHRLKERRHDGSTTVRWEMIGNWRALENGRH